MRATRRHAWKLGRPGGLRLPALAGAPLDPPVVTSVYYDVPGGSLEPVAELRSTRRSAVGEDPPAPSPFEELRGRLRHQLAEIERHDPGTRLGRDPESLHDMRVGVRRLRALLRAGRKLVATDTSELDGRLKELGRVLGEGRDLDVLLARLEDEASELDGGDAEQARSLLAALRTERSCSRARLLGALRSNEYLALLDDTARTIDSLEPNKAETSLDELADGAFGKLR